MERTARLLLDAERRAFQAEKWICISALLLMLVAVALGVVGRTFNIPQLNTGEIAVYAMAPLTFVGAALCTATGTHIAVDVIALVPSPALRRLSRLLVALALLAFGAVYLYTGAEFLGDALRSGERGLETGTPVAIPLLFLPLGMALLLLHAAAEAVRALRDESAPRWSAA